jgi:hypothetical protein
MKATENTQITEQSMLARLRVGSVLLSPLVVRTVEVQPQNSRADARIELSWPGEAESFWFTLESKRKANPQTVQFAVMQARQASKVGDLPMIQVPFLSPERLNELEKEAVSGIDLCGNGIVIVPGRLCVVRSGAPNQYPDSRPLSNPYRGRSAMVARMLLERPMWKSLSELAAAIWKAGADLSFPQISKAVQAMEEDLLLAKNTREITLLERLRLLDYLGREWRTPKIRARQGLRLRSGRELAPALSSNPQLKWAFTGESSAVRYAMFSQGGPRKIAVSSLPLAQTLLDGDPESVPSFADVELIETEEAGFFFGNEIDAKGDRWASRLQVWLELQSGDARQQDVAKDIREQIVIRGQKGQP